MNRPVHATATRQARIGGVDDGVDFERGDIRLDNFEMGHV
jgi:hypothetical protein